MAIAEVESAAVAVAVAAVVALYFELVVAAAVMVVVVLANALECEVASVVVGRFCFLGVALGEAADVVLEASTATRLLT